MRLNEGHAVAPRVHCEHAFALGRFPGLAFALDSHLGPPARQDAHVAALGAEQALCQRAVPRDVVKVYEVRGRPSRAKPMAYSPTRPPLLLLSPWPSAAAGLPAA